jgi:hypothetical protein
MMLAHGTTRLAPRARPHLSPASRIVMRARHLLPAVVALAAACGGEKTATTDTTASLNPVPSPSGAAAESASAVGGGTGGVTARPPAARPGRSATRAPSPSSTA